MTISEFKKEYASQAVELFLDEIKLTEKTHKSGLYTPNNKKPEDLLIVVRETPNEEYSLVCGWADYMEASARHLEKIRCIVTEDSRAVFMHRYNNKYIKTAKIIIPECFANTVPSAEKVKAKMEYYEKHGRFEKPISISRDNILVDGYISYLIAKEKGIKKLCCKVI